ncbi:TPA: tyrosine-type recombinase/integrase [Enterobacter asburiae]|nr:tyrosine-type recombinase/integrase [Enterobacter asburiae]HEC5298466.1 tyrosine-type recombinase/integrase [Enterobacter asburiae]
MGRRRNSDRRNLPPNLYIRNNGYYCYRDPRTGKEFGLGRDKRLAVNEAIQANIEIFSGSERKTLVSRINSDDVVTMHAWLDRYEIIITGRGLKQKTITDYGSKLRAIRERISDIPIADVTTKQIASLLNDYVSEGKSATAKLIRSTLSDIFREAIAEGHIGVNPVTATRAAKSEVKRARLTIEEYRRIYESARTLPEWVCLAMDLAVVTGQRVGDLCKMRWDDIVDGYLYVEQSKTSAKLAIPTKLNVCELGLSMEDILQKCKNLGGETIISSTRREPLSSGTISRYFMRARKASGLIFSGEPPTFHELRSLSARIYEKQVSDKFAQHLLGHKSDSMALQYRDDRGREWEKIEFQ